MTWAAGGLEGGAGGRVCCRPCSPEVATILGCVPGQERGDRRGHGCQREEGRRDPGVVSARPHFLARWCYRPAPRFLSHEMRSRQRWAGNKPTYFSEPQVCDSQMSRAHPVPGRRAIAASPSSPGASGSPSRGCHIHAIRTPQGRPLQCQEGRGRPSAPRSAAGR